MQTNHHDEYMNMFNTLMSQLDYSSEENLENSIKNTKNNQYEMLLNLMMSNMTTSINGFESEIETEEQLPEGEMIEIEDINDIDSYNNDMTINKYYRTIIKMITEKNIDSKNQSLTNSDIEKTTEKYFDFFSKNKVVSLDIGALDIGAHNILWIEKFKNTFKNPLKSNKIVLITSLEELINYVGERDDVILAEDFVSEITELLKFTQIIKSTKTPNPFFKNL